MNNSWLSDSTSPGFIYYQVDTTPSKENCTADFIAFTDHNPSPQFNRFSPKSYSSPQSFKRDSTKNFHKRNWKTNYTNKSYSPNNSFNSTFNTSRNRSHTNCTPAGINDSFNKATYCSFLENPWAQLEKRLNEEEESTNKFKDFSNSSKCDI